MGEKLNNDNRFNVASRENLNEIGKITVLEALAEKTEAIDISRSNRSTPPQGDPDDQ